MWRSRTPWGPQVYRRTRPASRGRTARGGGSWCCRTGASPASRPPPAIVPSTRSRSRSDPIRSELERRNCLLHPRRREQLRSGSARGRARPPIRDRDRDRERGGARSTPINLYSSVKNPVPQGGWTWTWTWTVEVVATRGPDALGPPPQRIRLARQPVDPDPARVVAQCQTHEVVLSWRCSLTPVLVSATQVVRCPPADPQVTTSPGPGMGWGVGVAWIFDVWKTALQPLSTQIRRRREPQFPGAAGVAQLVQEGHAAEGVALQKDRRFFFDEQVTVPSVSTAATSAASSLSSARQPWSTQIPSAS